MRTVKEEKQDIIVEAIESAFFGGRCGCGKKDCKYGCGIAFEALEVWSDVKKTLIWLRDRTKYADHKEILEEMVRRLEK